ncbi:MAG TPA: cell division protein SepF [Actinomycetes bacterium]|jgi:cell division inhibitor SepF|nr:cell division protein SepF [Actinomycetes bacterium]
MAGAMRKAMVYLGLVEEDDRYEYDEFDDPDGEGYDADHAGGHRSAGGREERHGGVATLPTTDRRPSLSTSRPFDRITTIHPRTYNEAKQIGESFRESTPVIMNLSDMDDSDAKRLVDFAAGLVFGLRGTIERVTNKVFLLSPADVTVTAEDKARMAESGFFNQS